MFKERVARAIAALREAAAQAAWAQWGAIFSLAGARRQARSVVDPEALLLGSMALGDQEPRLRRVQLLWAETESGILSVQRVKNLLPLFPDRVRPLVGAFARRAMMDGGDLRWKSVAGRSERATRRDRDRQGTPVLEGGAPLMLRLRLGMGVGIKADVVAYLIALSGGRASVQAIASATSYHGRAVRRAVEELAAAGFIEARPTAPVSYRVDLEHWARLLAIDPEQPPAWRSWSTVYAFVAALDDWSRSLPSRSDFVLASEAREIMREHEAALEGVVRLPSLDQTRGEAALEPFVAGLEQFVEFLAAVV